MGKQLLLNISEQVNLHINILICVLFLNIILIIFEIFRKLPRNIFIDKPLNIYWRFLLLIRFFFSYILFYPFFRRLLKRWNYKREHPDYDEFDIYYTARRDVWFSYYYLRCEVIKANLFLFFWSKTCKLKGFFYFFFGNLILNHYSIWAIYWGIRIFRWFMSHMSKSLIIFCWRIMLWVRIQIFLYINIDTFFSLLQSLNFIELEEEEDFVLDTPPFIFYYKLRKFFIKLFPRYYTRNSLFKIEFFKYVDIFLNLLKVGFGKVIEVIFFYYNKILFLFGFVMFYVFDNFNYIKLYLELELNYWKFFLNADFNSFREFFKELLKICYTPIVYLFLGFCVFMKKCFYNKYKNVKLFILFYKNIFIKFINNFIYFINVIVFNSVIIVIAFIYYFIRFTIFFRVLIFLLICLFFIDFKTILSYFLQFLNFFTDNINLYYFDNIHDFHKQVYVTRKYPKTEKQRYYKQSWLEKYLEVPKRFRKKRGLVSFEVGKYHQMRKRALLYMKLYRYRIKRWWKMKKWIEKIYYFKYAVIISKIKIVKYKYQRMFLRVFIDSKWIFIHSFFWTDLISFYFLALIELCFYLLAKWYAIVLYAVPSVINYNYILYFCTCIYYYSKLIFSYIFSILLEKLVLFFEFILIVIQYVFSLIHRFILYLNSRIKVHTINYLIWYIYIITKDLFSYNYLSNNLIENLPLIVFKPIFIIGPRPEPGSRSFFEWFNYFLNVLISVYNVLKWILQLIIFFVKTTCLMFDYLMSYYVLEDIDLFDWRIKIKLFLQMRIYLWRFFQKIIDFFSINYDVFRYRYDEHQRLATIRRRRTHPFFRMKFRSRTNSFVSYKRWGLTPKLIRFWDFEHLRTNKRWRLRNIERSRIIENYLTYSVAKKGRKMWGPRLAHFKLPMKRIFFYDCLQIIWVRNILKLNFYCIYFYPFLVIFLCFFTGFRKLIIRTDLENVSSEYYWKRFRLEPLENLNWLLFKISPFVRKELEKLKEESSGALDELIAEQQQVNLDPEFVQFENEARNTKKKDFFHKLNFAFDIDVIKKRYKILNKLEKDNIDFMHYYLSYFFEKFYFNLLLNSFVMSCIVSYGATKNKNLENALSMATDIEPVHILNYEWYSKMESLTQQISDYFFKLDKDFFSFKMPAWAFHKNMLNYQILALKTDGDTTFERYQSEYFHLPEVPSVIGHFFLLFLVIPVLLLNLYLKSVGYMIAGCGRGISMEWIHYFLNYYLRFDFIFSVHAQMSNVGLNVSGHRRNRSNYTGSWTPFRGRFRWGYFLRKRYIRYTHAWGDIVLTFRKQYTYSRLYFYKHLIFFNYCSYIFIFYVGYIFVILFIFLFFFNLYNTENYKDHEIPGRNCGGLEQDRVAIKLGIYLKVVRANLRKFLIKKF